MHTLLSPRRLAGLAVLALALLGLLSAGPASADEFTPAQRAEIVRILREALKKDPSILRDAVEAMKADDARHAADETRAIILAHRGALVSPDDPVAGNKDGAVAVVEFYDTRCPYCRQMEPTMATFLRQNHDVRLVYKDLPILGPASVLAARALLAAQKQGGYDKLRAALMQAPPDFTKDGILGLARKVGLDAARLDRDMADPAIETRLKANLGLARALGIDGTPALVIGDQLIPGAIELTELEKDVAAARAAH